MNAVLDELRFNHRPTGLPLGRPPGRNLARDGFEEVADWIKGRLLSVKGPHLVEIREDRGVRLTERSRLSNDEYAARVKGWGYVGTYNRKALIEWIENDLIEWMREKCSANSF